MSVCEIIPNLWLGNINIARNSKFFESNKIKLVLNCSKDISFYSNYTKNVRIAVDDNLKSEEIDKMYKYLDKGSDLINMTINRNEGVLVHCFAGKQRSATLIAAFLMKYANLKMKDAILSIKSKRLVAFTPCINFRSALQRYEEYLSNQTNND